jgi:hypothetical protein
MVVTYRIFVRGGGAGIVAFGAAVAMWMVMTVRGAMERT